MIGIGGGIGEGHGNDICGICIGAQGIDGIACGGGPH